MPPFHLALPVREPEATRRFFVALSGCGVGRESERRTDPGFRGHPIAAHRAQDELAPVATDRVDGERVPVRRFGLIPAWKGGAPAGEAAARCRTDFPMEPCIRFQGEAGGQATPFLLDPGGNGLEFEWLGNPARVFARWGAGARRRGEPLRQVPGTRRGARSLRAPVASEALA